MVTSNATAHVAPDTLIDQSIMSGATARKSAVDHEDLKLCWKSEKRPHFSW